MYYKLAFRSHNKISPILFVGIAVIAILIAGVTLTGNGGNRKVTGFNSKSNIVRFDIVGVTDSSISLFWRTDVPVIPKVFYSKVKDGYYQPIEDTRDTVDSQVQRRNHLITLSSLSPATKYYFRIENITSASGDNKPLLFEVKTAPRIDTSSTQPIYGKLVNATGKPVDNAIVLVKLENAYPLVTTTKNDGTFLLSTCCVIDAETFTSRSVGGDDPITTEIIDEEGNFLVVKDYYNHVSPFAGHLVLQTGSKTVDNLVVKKDSQSGNKLVLGAVTKQAQNTDTFSIIYPAQLAQIAYGNPLLKGTGVVGKGVKIWVDKTSFATSTMVDDAGVWRAQFRGRLPIGRHELIVKSADKLGNEVTLTRTFYVAKSGEQVLGEATGSATITPTITPQVTDSPLPTATLAVASPMPTINYATTAPVPPVTGMGIGLSSFLIGAVTLIVVGLGVILIF